MIVKLRLHEVLNLLSLLMVNGLTLLIHLLILLYCHQILRWFDVLLPL